MHKIVMRSLLESLRHPASGHRICTHILKKQARVLNVLLQVYNINVLSSEGLQEVRCLAEFPF